MSSQLTRRELLAGTAGAALSLRAGRAIAATPQRIDVVVVGAGLAGLVCAYELQRAGRSVTVLEARNRPGGRVYTVRKGFVSGQHAEGGGEFIDTGHAFMRHYVRHFGLALEDTRLGPNANLDGVVYFGRKRRSDASVFTPRVQREIGRFWSRVDELSAKLDPEDPVSRGSTLDSYSAQYLIDKLQLEPTAKLLVEHEIRDDFTVEPERLSLLYLCQSEKLTANQPDDGVEAFRILGGNDQLPYALADGLDDLRLEMSVRHIEIRPASVRAVTRDRDRVEAAFCVLTAPLPAVRHLIEFSPALPRPLRDAVETLRYGTATKTLVQYGRRFWRNLGTSGDILTDLTFQTAWEATSRQSGGPGILIAYTAGRNGHLYGGRSGGLRSLLAADEIDDVYRGSRRLFVKGISAALDNEEPTLGTYTAYSPGQVRRFWRVLRQPVGRLHLAGEHTDAYTGYMEGAVRSGRRAAATIEALL